jgi:hypothetical protein
LRNECATAGGYRIIDFFKGVASIPRAAAWNLLCHFATQASAVCAIALERVIQRSSDSRD